MSAAQSSDPSRPSGAPRKARVAVVVISDLEFGGAQRQVVELANHMDVNRYDLHVVTLHDYTPLGEALRDASRRLHVVQRRGKFDATVIHRLARLLGVLKASVVHGYLFDAEIAARLAGRIAGCAVIGSERNTDYHLKRINLIAYRLTRWAHDMTIANSRAGADFNRRTLGQRADDYRVVYNGVDLGRFHPRNSTALRAELGLKPEHRVVGMIASFKPQKNHLLLIRAAARVVECVPEARFLLVGDELFQGSCGSIEQKGKMLALMDELGLRNHFVLAGNRPEVEKYYNVADVTALPSLFEGTPNAALESMACGVPVVATDVSDNAQVIPDGRVGFIVPSNDDKALASRLIELLKDDAQCARMSAAAAQWVAKEFSCQRLADRTADVYDEAIRRKSPGN